MQTMVKKMASEDSSLPEGTLGYSYNRGGLNNQKLALFGLFLKAVQEGPRRIVLPNFILFDIVSYNYIPIQFDQVWRSRPLRDFAARHGIEIVDISPRGTVDVSWDYFHYARDYIPRS